GTQLHRIVLEVPDPNGAGLLAGLAPKVQAALKTTTPNARAIRGRESRRFLREAQLMWRHKSYAAGLQAAEAAFALQPSDDARNLLAEYLLCYATERIMPGGMRSLVGGSFKFEVTPDTLREVLVLARRGLLLIDNARAGLADKFDPYDVNIRVEPFSVTDAQRFFFNKVPYVRIVPADAE